MLGVALVAVIAAGGVIVSVDARTAADTAGRALLENGATALPAVPGNGIGTGHPRTDGARRTADVPPGQDRDRFQRFRLDAVDGARLRPNHDDLAARTVANGPLLLFLPATRARPADYTDFLSTATSAGYHVLGLDYWNLGRSLSRTCGGSPHCYTEVQRNRFDGSSASRYSAVQPAGSIVSRLRTAVAHLDAADPAGGWGRFVQNGRVQWQDVVVAGHSQGGSEAAYIGHIRSVQGVLMFGAPAVSRGQAHASWLDRPGRTPVDRMYALAHVDDHFGRFIRPSWRTLALEGARRPFVTRDGAPITDPHVIETTVPVPVGRTAHSIVVSDHTPEDASGVPMLLPVWEWMLGRFDVPLVHPEPLAGQTATAG
ncbi:BPSS1187 family protein [Curtobacterium sp. RRHDQ10]|uniref:BPSS1187 family protein n=1 Tax=Curtobacterium phyllosphaerae TaxID=3413379 RepID=UPI003BF28588